MRRAIPALAAMCLISLVPLPAHAFGRFVNIGVDIGGAIPFGPGLKETTFKQFPDWIQACEQGFEGVYALCNPAKGGFEFGAILDFNTPVHLGIGAGYRGTIFFRQGDPLDPVTLKENNAPKDSYINHYIVVPRFKLRVLDMMKAYKKKWGSFDIDIDFGFSLLYGTEWYFSLSQTLSYSYPLGNSFQIGLFIAFNESIPFAKRKTETYTPSGIEVFSGDLSEVWMSLGIRLTVAFADLKGKPRGEGEEGEGGGESEYTEKMKLMDSDGDGLNDYAEMMLGTSATSKDSDGDGIMDGMEDRNLNGMRDAGETDPMRADSDGGGASDSWEISMGYDPLNGDDDDRDMDLVVDDKDSCPGTPFGVAVGSAGCPTLTESVILDQVTFVEGTAELNPEGYQQLDMYAMILLQDPALEIVILAFGPPSGSKAKILELTAEQAQSIKDYLVLRGIDEFRITVSGEGKTPDGPKVELQPIIPF